MTEQMPAGTGADSTAPGAGSTAGQPDLAQLLKDNETWKSRFTGMQGKYQQTHDQLIAAQGRVADLEGQLAALNGDKDALGAEFDKTTGELGTLKTKVADLEAQHGRLKLIATDYPDLLPFEAQGILPAGIGDELKGKLTAFKAALDARGQAAQAQAQSQQAQTQMQQSTMPSPPPPAGSKDAKTLLSEAMAMARQGKMDEYNKLYSDYLALTTKEKTQ